MKQVPILGAVSSHRRILLRATVAAASCKLWPLAWAQGRKPGEVVLGGTGAGMAPLRKVLEGSASPVAQFVPNLGSGGGLKALAAGALDIAVSARRINDAERAQGMVERELFRTPFIWATHAGTPLKALTLAMLADFYAAKVIEWPDGRVVRLVLRPESDSDTQMVKSINADLSAAISAAGQRQGMRVAMTDDDAAADIERIDGAIGATTLAMITAQQRKVQVPTLGGVAPTVANLASGRYPHFKSIYLVTRGPATAEISATLAQLHSKNGAAALAQVGCLATAQA
jgi:phosphate transport system substrate-binding protein